MTSVRRLRGGTSAAVHLLHVRDRRGVFRTKLAHRIPLRADAVHQVREAGQVLLGGSQPGADACAPERVRSIRRPSCRAPSPERCSRPPGPSFAVAVRTAAAEGFRPAAAFALGLGKPHIGSGKIGEVSFGFFR